MLPVLDSFDSMFGGKLLSQSRVTSLKVGGGDDVTTVAMSACRVLPRRAAASCGKAIWYKHDARAARVKFDDGDRGRMVPERST